MSSPFHSEQGTGARGEDDSTNLSEQELDRLRAMLRLMAIGVYSESTDTSGDFTAVPPLTSDNQQGPLFVDPREIRQNYKF